MTPCQRDHNQIFDFIDGELASSSRKEVEKHVAECCDCARLLHKIRLQKTALKRLTRIKTGDAFFLLLQEHIRRESRGKHRRSFEVSSWRRRWIPAGVFAAFILTAGTWILMHRSQPSSISAIQTGNGRVPSKPMETSTGSVQYVIDDFAQNSARPPSASSTEGTGAAPDTAAKSPNFDELKSRLKTVSF
jgi:hypothetical protein